MSTMRRHQGELMMQEDVVDGEGQWRPALPRAPLGEAIIELSCELQETSKREAVEEFIFKQ